jgi:hypothetical protein
MIDCAYAWYASSEILLESLKTNEG